jgi:ABC-type phosphate transport system substrate-binding protein
MGSVRTSTRKDRSRALEGISKPRTLGAAAAFAACAAAALLLASAGGATAPPAGVNCQADGKISGRGATFAWFAQWNFMRLYRSDVCGPVSDTAGPGGASTGDTMVLYNGTNGADTQVAGNQGAFIGALAAGNFTAGALTGSGNGRNSQICRATAFGGSDAPYTASQLATMDAVPANSNCTGSFDPSGTASDYFDPFNPTVSPYPNAADTQAPIMSFPIAVSDVAVIVNFNATASGTNTAANATCRSGALNLTPAQVSRLMGGDILNWSSVIPGCLTTTGAEIPIKRVVRRDNSGTSQIFLNYLGSIDPSRNIGGAASCDTGILWTKNQLNPLAEGQWPGDGANTTNCSPIVHGWKNGNPGVLDVLDGAHQPTPGAGAAFPQRFDATLSGTFDDNGAIGYADLADTENQIALGAPGFKLANVRNATNTAFVNSAAGSGANCDTGSIVQPGAGQNNIVGITDAGTANTTDNWATDQTSPANRADITNKGKLYPVCGMTWLLVYTGLSDGTIANPNSRLNADQRRNLYSYISFILSSPAQALLDQNFYASLPSKLSSDIRAGFQFNFSNPPGP